MPKHRSLPLADVRVGKRFREDLGDLHELAVSMDERGLIHPIVVDGDDRLVAGHRRLKAAKILGWKTIHVRDFGDLSSDERLAIELEENTKRKVLAAAELMKAHRRLIKTAGKIVDRETRVSVRGGPKKKPGRGRPSKPTSLNKLAERTGISKGQQIRDTRHEEIIDQHPFMATPKWNQRDVLKAGEILDGFDKKERKRAVKLIESNPVPLTPKAALQSFGRLSAMGSKSRSVIFDMSESGRKQDRVNAMDVVLDLPLDPDPAEVCYMAAIREIERCVNKRDADELTPRFKDDMARLKQTLKTVETRRKECHRTLKQKIARSVSAS